MFPFGLEGGFSGKFDANMGSHTFSELLKTNPELMGELYDRVTSAMPGAFGGTNSDKTDSNDDEEEYKDSDEYENVSNNYEGLMRNMAKAAGSVAAPETWFSGAARDYDENDLEDYYEERVEECTNPNCHAHTKAPRKSSKTTHCIPPVEYILSQSPLNPNRSMDGDFVPLLSKTPDIKAIDDYRPNWSITWDTNAVETRSKGIKNTAEVCLREGYDDKDFSYIFDPYLIKAASISPSQPLAPLIFPAFDTNLTKWQPLVVFKDTTDTGDLKRSMRRLYKREVWITNKARMLRFNKVERYLHSNLARDLLRRAYKTISPMAYRKDADAQNEDKYMSHLYQHNLQMQERLQDKKQMLVFVAKPKPKSVDVWRKKVFNNTEVTAKVRMNSVYFEVDAILSNERCRGVALRSVRLVDTLFGPYVFHACLRQAMFEDLMADKGVTAEMTTIFQTVTVERFSSRANRPWKLTPLTWETAPKFAGQVRKSLHATFGTTIPVDLEVDEWPKNFVNAMRFHRKWEACREKMNGDERMSWEDVCQVLRSEVSESSGKFLNLREREEADGQPWNVGRDLPAAGGFFSEYMRCIALQTWDPDVCKEGPKAWETPGVHQEERFLSPAFLSQLLSITSPYSFLNAIRVRFDEQATKVGALTAPKIGRGLATLCLDPLYSPNEKVVREFVGTTWEEYLKPLYTVFFSCHTEKMSSSGFVALWLYSVITTGYGQEDEKGSPGSSSASSGAHHSNMHTGFHSKKKKKKSKRPQSQQPQQEAKTDQSTQQNRPSMKSKLYRKMYTQAELMIKYPALGRVFTTLYDLTVEPTAYQLKLQMKGNASYQNLICKDWFEEQYGYGWDSCVQPEYQTQMLYQHGHASDDSNPDASSTEELACQCQVKKGMQEYIEDRQAELSRQHGLREEASSH